MHSHSQLFVWVLDLNWVLTLNRAGIELTTESTPSLLLFSGYF